ncbi:serine/threonine-protein kinase [Pseudoclavibacter sp. 13-3]|uniref:serine/threonine-protein kinase n=1 Tax=Pseudoclavibacter sp. 13-3 TaxID=2901228 RepID=UPI001E641ED5|nr:serine/threonine protein kinase [Pseudoclavibacter sp. 13-3]
MNRRPPSTPPALPGFTPRRLIGSGGFADVFLYEQHLPRRLVAVKVLLREQVTPASVEAFNTEANIMAQFSSHPSIVSVYQAGTSSDGRPYLVMQYCPKPNLQQRRKRGDRFSESETLTIGIRIASALEIAHRSDVLHRDVKPANILTTEYGQPALTDFGIAAAVGSEVEGLSVPWSPPEAFGDHARTGPAGDVYSLAATLYTLLASRTPYEIPGGQNRNADLIDRIRHRPLPPLGRPDVSPALTHTLTRALAKNPQSRPRTAVEFARDLQRVQIHLKLRVTDTEVPGEAIVVDESSQDVERTRFRNVSAPAVPGSIVPMPIQTAHPVAPSARRQTPPQKTLRPQVGTIPVGAGVRSPTKPRGPRRAVTLGVSIVAGAIIGVSAVVGIRTVMQGTTPAAAPQPAVATATAAGAAVPAVTGLRAYGAGTSRTFTWSNPQPMSGDTYRYRMVGSGGNSPLTAVNDPRVTVEAVSAGPTCIEVTLVRDDHQTSDPVQGCSS